MLLSQCSSLLPVTVTHTHQKQLGEKKVYLAFTSMSQSIIKGSQDRNAIKLEARTMEESCLLAVVSWFAQFSFFI